MDRSVKSDPHLRQLSRKAQLRHIKSCPAVMRNIQKMKRQLDRRARAQLFFCLATIIGTSNAFAAEPGAVLYAQSCARCHDDGRALAMSVRGRTASDVAASLEAFLSHHHTNDAATRQQIVDYLVGLRG